MRPSHDPKLSRPGEIRASVGQLPTSLDNVSDTSTPHSQPPILQHLPRTHAASRTVSPPHPPRRQSAIPARLRPTPRPAPAARALQHRARRRAPKPRACSPAAAAPLGPPRCVAPPPLPRPRRPARRRRRGSYDLTPGRPRRGPGRRVAPPRLPHGRASARPTPRCGAAHAAYESRFGHAFVICLDGIPPRRAPGPGAGRHPRPARPTIRTRSGSWRPRSCAARPRPTGAWWPTTAQAGAGPRPRTGRTTRPHPVRRTAIPSVPV